MLKISKSPQRHSFQREKYMERKSKEITPEEADEIADMEEMFATIEQNHSKRFDNPESREVNLEYDLLTTDWILEKVRSSETYAQNLYASMCNNDFQKLEVIPILKNKKWSCSWRYAGGIVADMRQEGDYIDWYCSGIRDTGDDNESIDTNYDKRSYVSECIVTDEIREDLKKLGWIVITHDDI